MKIDIAHLCTHWKSTAQSILTTTFAITGFLATTSIIKPKTAAVLITVNGLCKVLIGILQTDGISLPPGSTLQQNTKITTPPAPPSQP